MRRVRDRVLQWYSSFGSVDYCYDLLSLLCMKKVLALMNTPEDIFADAYSYISVICMGIVASVAYNYFAACLRAIGNSKVPLVTLVFSAV